MSTFSGPETPAYSRTVTPTEDPSLTNSVLAVPKPVSDSDCTTSDSFNLEEVLSYIIQARDNAHIPNRQLGVMFKDLHVTGVGSTTSYADTIASTLNPINAVKKIQNLRKSAVRDILTGFEGTVKPGEMLLVLGSPGSGCTSLLKTLANQRAEYHTITGEVYYDSITSEALEKQYRGDVIFCPEDDIHLPTLTVEQTIKFAAACRAPHLRAGLSKEEYINSLTDLLLRVFGLTEVRHTKVGDAAIRGVSGGQKKRVSICEALAARANIISWDGTTRGLDASTALEFAKAIRTATDVCKLTSIVSLYQVGESLYNLFDKVCVIYEGRMAYYGPAAEARDYFINMGYEPANRQTTADFLVAVTNPPSRILRAVTPIAPLPRDAAEFATYFLQSQIGQMNTRDIEAFTKEYVGKPELLLRYKESVEAEHANHTNPNSPYITSVTMQARALIKRRLQMLRGDMTLPLTTIGAFLFQGTIIGTIFLQLKDQTSDFFSRGGVLFFVLLVTLILAISEIPALFGQRPVILRHRDWAFSQPFVDQIAFVIIDIPVTFISILALDIVVYFLAGFQVTAQQFFLLLLFTFISTLCMKAFFRALTASCKTESTAQMWAGLIVLVLALYTGYTLPAPTMIGALKWLTHLNPLKYSFEALMSNEFRTLQGTCSSLVPQGPGYENITLANQVCTVVGSVPGEPFVQGSQFILASYGYSYSRTWVNFGIVCAFMGGFLVIQLFAAQINTKSTGTASIVQFKRGSKTAPNATRAEVADEEKGELSATLSPTDSTKVEVDTATNEVFDLSGDIFSWQDLTYTVMLANGKPRRLLDNVCGFVAPGKLTALMGESGAGKTTLLNVLAQRTDVGIVGGNRFVNGQGLPKDFQSQTGYCQQQDTHVPTDTVYEALMFSARLRQPARVPLSEKEAYVEQCLILCGLVAYRDAMVGSLSTEHKKRVTIAVELSAKPALLLFLDEPTSGLDSQSAWAIVSFLRHLADNGQAILCTIHQPSAELFQVFDRLLLLRKGGETVYFGDIGRHAVKLIKYFEDNGSRKCECIENPAEFMLDVIGAGATSSSAEDWGKVWRTSAEARNLTEELEAIHSEGRNRSAAQAATQTEFSTPWMTQITVLMKRQWNGHWRDPNYLTSKLLLNVCSGLFIGFSFYDRKDTPAGAQNLLFALFMATIMGITLGQQIQLPFMNMRNIYEIRERPSRMYSWTALVTSQFLLEMPWNILGSSLFYFCWYWTVGFDSSRAGYTYLALCVMFPLYYCSIALAVAALSNNAELAGTILGTLFTFVLPFCGIMQPYALLGWWQWMYNVSPYTYLIGGIVGQAVGHKEIRCIESELSTIIPPTGQTCSQFMGPYISMAGGYLTNPDASDDCRYCYAATTDAFLKSVNIRYDTRWRNIGILVVFVGFNLLCMYFLTYWFRIKTGSIFDRFKKKRSPPVASPPPS